MHILLLFLSTVVLIPPRGDSQCIQNVPTTIAAGPGTSVLGPSGPGPGPTIQAIIPQYTFNCSGYVTQWRVAVKMKMPRPMALQIWRPIDSSPTTVYSLVRFNQVSGVGELFSIMVPVSSQISVMAGDVIGYSYGGTSGDWKIQVNTASSQITAYYVTTAEADSTASLRTYTNTAGAPIISAVLQQVALPSLQTSRTSSATLSTTPAFEATTASKTQATIIQVNVTGAAITQATIVQETVTRAAITQATIVQGTVTRADITTDVPTTLTLIPPTSTSSPPVVIIVVTVTALLTVLLILVASTALILLRIKQQKKQRLGTVKREAMNQHYTDTTLQKISLVPLVTKTQDGFHFVPEMSLSNSYTSTIEKSHVNCPNHYSLAHSSVGDDCPDDVMGQFYTAPKTTLPGADAQDEPNIAVGRYEKVETNKYDTTSFLDDMYWSPALTASGLYEQLAAHKYEEIPISQLRILSVLGSGQFGQVSRGQWTVATVCTKVAVKMLKDGASEEDKVKFLQEAAIMGQFSHPNVVKMYGVVTIDDPPMIVLELMAGGDLHSFLIMPTILQKYGHEQLEKMFLKFTQEIAFGMQYLSRKSFVHRDLAARNILLTNNLKCKIGDFGMARNLINEVYYTTKGGVIPVKWTAPEALLYKKYSSASDVYSFGMVMYEMWSLGTKPFHDLRNADVPEIVSAGYCLAPPPGCPRAIYSLMVDCWHPHYDKRPHFKEVVDYFKKPEELLLYWSAEDHASAGGGADIGSPLSFAQHLFPDLQNRYKESQEHC